MILNQARVHGMEQIDGSVYYDSNGENDDDDEDDGSTFHNAIQVDDVTYDTDDKVDDSSSYGKTINNNYFLPVRTEDGATGVTIEVGGVLHVQYCHCNEIYYQTCEIYGDDPDEIDEAIEMMVNSSEYWSLCDGAPPPQGHIIISFRSEKEYNSEMDYDRQIMEINQRLAFQGLLDNYSDVGITEAELQATQAPLKQGTRRPVVEDWERMRKYLENVPADMVRNTFKDTIHIGILPPSSHLQRQFMFPNPALNIH